MKNVFSLLVFTEFSLNNGSFKERRPHQGAGLKDALFGHIKYLGKVPDIFVSLKEAERKYGLLLCVSC